MKNIQLYIGEVNYSQNKTAWLPTIDSVLATQKFLKSKFLYRTVIIFRKNTMQDISYPMTNSLYYSTSEFDNLIVHSGTNIVINENAYYSDGTYFYYYLVMYSNTFGLWNVVNNNSIYAVLYDQSAVTIQGGANYIMNEFRITRNVSTLYISGGEANNVYNLILPNQMPDNIEYATYTQFSNIESFELFNMGLPLSNQEIDVYKGLIYTTDFSELIAIPKQYPGDLYLFRSSKKTSSTVYKKISLHQNCQYIRNLSFNDDSSGNAYSVEIDEITGNVLELQPTALAFTNIKKVNFPLLKDIKDEAFRESHIQTLILPNTLTSASDSMVIGCNDLTTVILGNNFNCSISLQGAENINPILFGQQFYHLLPQDKDYPKSISVQGGVYDGIPQADLDYALSINWNIISI